MKLIKKASALLLSLCAVFALTALPAFAADGTQVDPILILSGETTLTVSVDGQISADLSGKYPYGETASITAPDVAEKTFLYWTNGSGEIVSYAQSLTLTMYAHTAVNAVYGDGAATPDNLAAFTSISRYGDAIAFCGTGYAASGEVTDSGVLYSTTASTLSDLQALSPDEAIEKSGSCWTLLVTPEDENTTYYAVAYAVAGGETSYSAVKTVKPSELESGVSFIANLGEMTLQGTGANLCNVSFDPNGGDGVMAPQGFVKGEAAALNANTFTREDYFFTGWSTTPTGSVTYTDRQSVTLSGDTTLYAQWGQPAATVDTAPAAKKLTYNGQAQKLVSEGKASGGTLVYSTAKDGSYSADIPTGKDAKSYTVWYMVQGDKQHTDSAPESVEVTIEPKEVGLKWSNTKFTSDGKRHVPTAEATGLVSGDTCTVTVTGAQAKAGKYTATAKQLSNSNYKLPANVTRNFTITGGDSNSTYDTLTADEKKTADDVAKALGVDKKTAAKMVTQAKRLGVSADILKLSEKTLAKMDVDSKDAKGSSFYKLKARSIKRGSTSQTLKWKQNKNADGYLIYGAKCGKKNKMKLLKTVKSSKISEDNKTFTAKLKKLKKGTYYKFMVVAYKKVNGKKMPIAASVTVHSPTTGGKVSVAKSLKVKRQTKDKKGKKVWKKVSELTVKKGKSVTIKATEVLEKKRKAKYKPHREVKFVSSKPKIAMVSGKGKITGKKKGKATVYVYNQNGLYKTVKVTVK